ncbi:LLM class flavin-dependent oxidoreductase [Rhodococcus ruber]|uniref:LLM class flavin-dependent oxidoreductase n=1 Tax=Rhodococcus ruber TaxID=1830 RepID=A0ABT4MD97_9NOCA|nr:LLM class flavin-dependent oxidoreductase [Rhodococcus ruber]MCZ4518940.1 LLM class flavin-dependent oxidoreductase [Rhodococcus ruber]
MDSASPAPMDSAPGAFWRTIDQAVLARALTCPSLNQRGQRQVAKTIETGIFLPVGNHGWIHSANSPAIEDGSFGRVLDITRRAELRGFDFALSPAIWRGRKGPTNHWMHALESITTSAALLQATDRIKVFATTHMVVYPPATIAKMVSTLDQIGPGRVGLNLVTGASYLDMSHVGLWNDDLDHDKRYDLGDEWISLVKQFWTDEIIDFKGEFFETDNGHMGPKPSKMPELVNAGSSDRGFRFAAENCDIAFTLANDEPKYLSTVRRTKEAARELGRTDLKTYGSITLVPAETDALAEARVKHFNDGVDSEAVLDIIAGYAQNKDAAKTGANSKFFTEGAPPQALMDGYMSGSYDTLAERLATIVNDGDLDGIMLIVPDYTKDLDAVTDHIFPKLAEYGVLTRVTPNE